MSFTPSIITCNLNCICTDVDCVYKHFINYKERKIVKKFYDSLSTKIIEETNNESRKKNCTFGQLCENKDCGFRHRLNFNSREKLIVLYKFNKIRPSINEDCKKTVTDKPITNKITTNNLFMTLDDDIEDEKQNFPSITIITSKSWASVVKAEKKEIGDSDSESDDINYDDDFYMKF